MLLNLYFKKLERLLQPSVFQSVRVRLWPTLAASITCLILRVRSEPYSQYIISTPKKFRSKQSSLFFKNISEGKEKSINNIVSMLQNVYS
jgi:hypothetical protein